MKTTQRIFAIAFLLLATAFASAQNFQNLIGVRGGYAYGITFQHYLAEDKAIELILDQHWRGVSIIGLYEIHKPAFNVDGMFWYYGVGGHIGSYPWYEGHPWRDNNDNGSLMVIGVDGILGLEYFIPEIPIQISADWKPAFNLIGYSRFWGDGGALSIRYCW